MAYARAGLELPRAQSTDDTRPTVDAILPECLSTVLGDTVKRYFDPKSPTPARTHEDQKCFQHRSQISERFKPATIERYGEHFIPESRYQGIGNTIVQLFLYEASALIRRVDPFNRNLHTTG